MATLFDEALSMKVLDQAWRRVRSNRGSAGADRIEIGTFGRMVPEILGHLAIAVRAGGYRPGLLRQISVPKASGGTRLLAIPCVADRILQTAAVIVLMPVVDPMLSPQSYAYRPGRSAKQAICLANDRVGGDRRWIFRADIKDCFGSISSTVALAAATRHVADERLLRLMKLWLDDFSAQGLGLPQGAPLSPLLCNLVLDPIDKEIADAGWSMVRYADDLLVACRGRLDAFWLQRRLSRALRLIGLSLSPAKTSTVPARHGVPFLGGWVGMRENASSIASRQAAESRHARLKASVFPETAS